MKLLAKVILRGHLITKTGLHIGGSKSSLTIGGIDNNIIKTAMGQPYIPGSSLKGKLRSLLARKEGSLFFSERDRLNEVEAIKKKQAANTESKIIQNYLSRLEIAKTDDSEGLEYLMDLFGFSADAEEEEVIRHTRLIVRDALLVNAGNEIFKDGFTHAKWENVINRRTGTAEHPRQMERVPVGAKFQMELVYNLYDDVLDEEGRLFSHLHHILMGLKFLEDDFIGGSGSRGYGQVAVKIDLASTCVKEIKDFSYQETDWELGENKTDALKSFRKALENFNA